ncbi:MAG: 50S ribosomal protein L35 [Lentisphaeria bacterium]|jgi:large subunit ribosomal protein L35
MPKMKTRKCVAKRVKQTATGKILRKQAGVRHLSTGKSRKRKRTLTQDRPVAKISRNALALALPYGL